MQGLSDNDKKRKIYRTYDIERFEQMLIDGINIFVAPKKWEDPYEDILFSIFEKNNNYFKHYKTDGNQLFGQCWTFNEDSDAMWRIYSKKNRVIKVEVILEEYHNHLEKICVMQETELLITKVNYLKQSTLEKSLLNSKSDANLLYGETDGWDDFKKLRMKSLSIKRKEFEHEADVRVLLHKKNILQNDVFRIEFDINEIFNTVTLDPRLSNDEFKHLKKKLGKLGFVGQIKQSKLYQLSEEFQQKMRHFDGEL